jgi:hypothetical protein
MRPKATQVRKEWGGKNLEGSCYAGVSLDVLKKIARSLKNPGLTRCFVRACAERDWTALSPREQLACQRRVAIAMRGHSNWRRDLQVVVVCFWRDETGTERHVFRGCGDVKNYWRFGGRICDTRSLLCSCINPRIKFLSENLPRRIRQGLYLENLMVFRPCIIV